MFAPIDPSTTAELLLLAASRLVDAKPAIVVDSAVNKLVVSGILKRLLAMSNISFSNSLIELWWRALKHQWLFLSSLESVTRIEMVVAFYVDEHNTRLPPSAFRGQATDKICFGNGDRIPAKLEAAKNVARQYRMQQNRETGCHSCRPLQSIAS